MAKTTTTSGKSKTTKSKSKSAAANTARKTTRIASAKRSPAKKTTVKKTKNNLKLELERLNIASIGLFAILIGLAVAFMNNVSYQLSLGYLAKDGLTGELAPAIQPVHDIELRWIVVLLLLLASILPVLSLTKFKNNKAYLRANGSLWRWLEVGITWAIMAMIVLLLSGLNDWLMLKVLGALVVGVAVLGWSAHQADTPVQKRRLYILGLLLAILPWLFVAAYAVSTVVYGMTTAPWYLYVLYAVTLGGMFALFRKELKVYRQEKGWTDEMLVERNVVLIGLVTKVLFVATLIAAFQA